MVEVEDGGPGLSDADTDLVFERFFRSDPSRSRLLTRGAGLGLAIVASIVTAHGGSVEVGEGSDGRGAVPRRPCAPPKLLPDPGVGPLRVALGHRRVGEHHHPMGGAGVHVEVRRHPGLVEAGGVEDVLVAEIRRRRPRTRTPVGARRGRWPSPRPRTPARQPCRRDRPGTSASRRCWSGGSRRGGRRADWTASSGDRRAWGSREAESAGGPHPGPGPAGPGRARPPPALTPPMPMCPGSTPISSWWS